MELINVPEAAKTLRISKFTLRSWVYAKKIPTVRLGRRVLFDKGDLEAFVNKHKVNPKGDVWNENVIPIKTKESRK